MVLEIEWLRIGETRHTLDCMVTKPGETNKTCIHISLSSINLWKKPRLFVCLTFLSNIWVSLEHILFGHKYRGI